MARLRFWITVILLFAATQCSNGRRHFMDVNSDIKDESNDLSCVFNVRSFGAVGDGYTDDTRAFHSAWKAACSVESGVLLVPSDGVFMITSTIFSGPCNPETVFQVSLRSNAEYDTFIHDTESLR